MIIKMSYKVKYSKSVTCTFKSLINRFVDGWGNYHYHTYEYEPNYGLDEEYEYFFDTICSNLEFECENWIEEYYENLIIDYDDYTIKI